MMMYKLHNHSKTFTNSVLICGNTKVIIQKNPLFY